MVKCDLNCGRVAVLRTYKTVMSRPSGRIVVLATYETLCRGLDHGHKHLFKTPGSAYLCLHVEKDTSVFLRFFEVHIIIIVYIILI